MQVGWGDPRMRSNRLRADVRAILWGEVPPSLRLAVLVFSLLAAYATGIAWAIAAGYQVEVVRVQARAELVEVRAHVRNLWKVYEALRIQQDRIELETPGWVAVPVAGRAE